MKTKSRWRRLCLVAMAMLAVTAAQSRAQDESPSQFLGKTVAQWTADLGGSDAQKRNAAFALGKLGKHAVPAAGELVRTAVDSNPKVREASLYALGEIGLRSVSLGKNFGVQSAFVTGLKDPEPLVRRSAAFGLGCLGPDASLARKDVEDLLKDTNPEVRQSVAWALGRMGDEGVMALVRALRDPDTLVLRDAALSIGQLDGKAARPAADDLVKLASHSDLEVKKAATFALVGIVKPVDASSPNIIGPLQRGLLDGDEEVRRNAAFALSNIGGPPAAPGVEVLLDALKNGDVDVKRQAAAAFGNIGPAAERAVPELIACLREPDNELRSNAIQAIGGLKEKAEPAVPALVGVIADPKQPAESRARAASALNKIGEVQAATRAVPQLLAVATDPAEDGKVRERIMWALRVHKEKLRELPGVAEGFRKILAEPSAPASRMVRQDCAYLTGMIFQAKAPAEIFPVLLEYLKDESLTVYRDTKVAVSASGAEAGKGEAKSKELGEGDGRKLALDALHAIGPAVVRTQPAILEQIRILAESDRVAPRFKEQCQAYLKTVN